MYNELVFMLIYECMCCWFGDVGMNVGGWGWDVISYYGGVVGNFVMYFNGGVEVCFGWKFFDDFGSILLCLVGENIVFICGGKFGGWFWYLFGISDVVWVICDIILDGNMFCNSYSVDKCYVVG